ncbi:MAG: nicotinate (nicotinamide) nucleotide adenylyltransferase [Magnetococcales bacterium]|nr:nicotinate (nicotinamide) nucleotide adenylyltransferase [Magnetococcales bacterium]
MSPSLWGLFGGAFNPPHYGHLRSALEVVELLRLERLLFLPSGGHPFKGADLLAPTTHRVAMTALAIAGEPRFALSTVEADRPGVSYTVDTLTRLSREHPDRELVLLLGTDLLEELHLWKDWRTMIDRTHLCLLTRPGFPENLSRTPAGRFLASHRVDGPAGLHRAVLGHHGFLIQPVTMLEISSTDLRHRVAAGRSLRYLTPEPVAEYIQRHGLYATH